MTTQERSPTELAEQLDPMATVLDVAREGAERVRKAAQVAITERDRFVLGLTAGSATHKLYRRLGEQYRHKINWEKTVVVFTDERFVPRNDRQSTYRAANDELLSWVPLLDDNIHTVRTEDPPEQAAQNYEHSLNQVGTIDLAVLALRADGGVASLYPGRIPESGDQLCTLVEAPEGSAVRTQISMTYKSLLSARQVLILALHPSRAETLRDALNNPSSETPIAHLLRNGEPNQVRVLLDFDTYEIATR